MHYILASSTAVKKPAAMLLPDALCMQCVFFFLEIVSLF